MKPDAGKGDKGCTCNMNSDCVSKASHEIEAIGAIDELCSYMGVLKQVLRNHEEKDLLIIIINDLFSINSIISSISNIPSLELKNVKIPDFSNNRVKFIEEQIVKYEKELPKLNHFIISFDDASAAKYNYVRSICRRAERKIFVLADKKEVPETVSAYINRLSDLFFILARWNNRDAEVDKWNH